MRLLSDQQPLQEKMIMYVAYLALLLLFVLAILGPHFKPRKNIPPGPPSWPLVGNYLQLGHKAHATLGSWARTYGQLISVKLGTQLVIVASSPSAAAEILKTQDRLLSGRDIPHTYRIENYIDYSLAFATDCNDRWKSLRTICKAELFTTRMLDSQAHLREKKVSEVIRFIFRKQGESLKVAELAFATVLNIIGNVVFSRDVHQLDNDSKIAASGLRHDISRVLEIGLAPNLADFYPVFGSVDIQGLNREATDIFKRLNIIWDEIIQERRATGYERDSKSDFLNILLCAGYDDPPLRSLFTDMFIAGTDTTSTLTEWTMSEFARNPDVMRKVKAELETVVGPRRSDGENAVKESHLTQLKYLHACVKEALRMHPPAPLLLPRRALQSCEVLNYTIPEGSRLLVNVWAMGRDPKIWKDPMTFSPERFLDSSVEYKGNHFEFTPFGGGRRICPGLPLAARTVQLILASFIHNFDWSLPDGMQPDNLNMDEKYGLALEKEHPLFLVPKSTVV